MSNPNRSRKEKKELEREQKGREAPKIESLDHRNTQPLQKP